MAKWFSASPPAFLTSAGLLHPLLQRIQPPASSSSPNGPIRHCATVVATSPCFPRAGRIRPRWDGHDATGQEQPSSVGCLGQASEGHFRITLRNAWLWRKPRAREPARLGTALGGAPRHASQRGDRSPCVGDGGGEEGSPGRVASLLALLRTIISTFCCRLKILK